MSKGLLLPDGSTRVMNHDNFMNTDEFTGARAIMNDAKLGDFMKKLQCVNMVQGDMPAGSASLHKAVRTITRLL